MNSGIQNLISAPAFWLGIIACIVIIWLVARMRRYFPRIFRTAIKQVSQVREGFSTSTDARLRNDIYRHAQKQHIAASLFSLDEIAIVPKVLTPLIQSSQSIELAPTDSVSLVVPYLPDWPEFATVYRASTMTLIEALQGGANIILAGHPGSGKTVALAWLASALARNQTGMGSLEGLLPVYAHAEDILYFLHSTDVGIEPQTIPENDKTPSSVNQSGEQISEHPLEVIIKAISSYATALTLPRLPSIVRAAVEKRHAIFILDGMDELPPTQSATISNYISSLLEKFPEFRVIVALSFENLAGLPPFGFSLLAMAAWGDYEKEQFLSQWSKQWTKWIHTPEKDASKKINPSYLNNWLKTDNDLLNPLEYTLKTWSAYAGDVRGTDGPSAIEAYLLRMIGSDTKARAKIEKYALDKLLDKGYSPEPAEPDSTTTESEIEANPLNPEVPASTAVSDKTVVRKPSPSKAPGGIDDLIDNGLMVSFQGGQYQFSHSIFAGFLAGNALVSQDVTDQIINLPSFIGKTLALQYLAYFGDVTPFINKMIQEDDILHTSHLMVARWLQVAPKNRAWRSTILRTLAVILQKEKDTLGLAAKIIAAIALSGDKGVVVYFRQLMKGDHPILKQLAALGCGVLGEKKAITELNEMLQEQSPGSIRAASLAMAAIGDKQSLEILATNLLSGNELMRRCAAEALANDPVEGHPALKDGSTMEDLMVRRAVAFGLIRINLPWATKIVENMQLEDAEWVVRNAAIQAFDELKRKSNYAPRPLPELTEAQWLINYATRIGTTVAPGKPADELVIKALANGTPDEILSALDVLRYKCDPSTIKYIYATYVNSSGEIKDIAYHILWLMMIAGIKLPIAIKYKID